jgi:hypothetical protein
MVLGLSVATVHHEINLTALPRVDFYGFEHIVPLVLTKKEGLKTDGTMSLLNILLQESSSRKPQPYRLG